MLASTKRYPIVPSFNCSHSLFIDGIVIYILRILFLSFLILLLYNTGNTSSNKWTLLGPGDADMVTSLSFIDKGVLFVGTDVGGLYMSKDLGETWEHRNKGIKNYDITTPVIVDPFDSNIIYVGTRGGFYKSENCGLTWTSKWKGLFGPKLYSISAPIGAITLSKKKQGLIYMGFGCRPDKRANKILQPALNGLLYKSIDGGESWKPISIIHKGALTRNIVLSPLHDDWIYIATDYGIFLSKDIGYSWSLLIKGDFRYIYFNPQNNNELFASMGEKGLMRSKDSGKTWDSINEGLPIGTENNYSVILGHLYRNFYLYALNSTWKEGGGLYRITGKAQKWVRLTHWYGKNSMSESWLKSSKRLNAIAVNPENKDQIFIGSSRYIYRSDDSGRSWKQVISKRITSNGWTHKGINVFGQTRAFAVDPSNMNRLYIGTTDHGFLKSEDKGRSWKLSVNGIVFKDNIWDIAISKSEPKRIYVINLNVRGDCGVARSDDYGEKWYQTSKIASLSPVLYDLLPHPNNADILYAAGEGGIYRTVNGGKSWRTLNNGLHKLTVNTIAIDPKEPTILFAGTDRGLFKSVDGGEDWEKIIKGNFGIVTSILVDIEDFKTIFVGTRASAKGKGAIFKSINGGETWQTVLRNVRWVSSLVQIPSHPNIIYASTNDENYHDESSGSGVFRSNDKGKTWQSLNDGLSVLRAYRLVVSPVTLHEVYLCSNGSGVYVIEDPINFKSH